MKTHLLFIPLSLIGLLFCLSCNKKQTEQEMVTETKEIPIIDLEQALEHISDDQVNFSEFIEDITYVPLETNNKSLLGGNRGQIWHVTDNYIFAGEMMFRKDGSFVRELGKKGQGPKEYILARGMSIDETQQEFYVYDNASHNIFIYDFDNHFKKKIKSNSYGENIYAMGNSKLAVMRTGGYFFDDYFEYQLIDVESEDIVYTRKLDIIKNGEKEQGSPFGIDRNIIWPLGQQFSYYEFFTDTIFSLENGIVSTPRFIINFGKYKFSEEIMHRMGRKDFTSAERFKYVRIEQIVECNRFLFFSLILHQTTYYVAYDKTTGEIRINDMRKFFNNDIDGGFLWLFNDTSDGKEGFYYVLPYIAKERIAELSSQNKGYDKEKNKKLRQLIDNLAEDDNEVVIFFHFKK